MSLCNLLNFSFQFANHVVIHTVAISTFPPFFLNIFSRRMNSHKIWCPFFSIHLLIYYVGLFFFIPCTLLFDGKEKKKQRRWISAKQRLWQVASGNTGNQIHFLHLKIVYYYRLTEAYLRSHEYRCQNELQQLNLSRDYPKWQPIQVQCKQIRRDDH